MPTPEEIATQEAAATAAKGGDGKGGGNGKGGDDKGTSALAAGQEKPETWIPEKYHVRKDGKKDGAIDVEASMRAVAKAHGELTKRMADVGLPPENADKYELELPKGFDIAEFRKDPTMTDFLKGAHSQGLTNKQINYVVNKYLEAAPGLVGAAAELSNEECVAQLALTWKSDAEMTAGIAASFRAATKLAQSAGMKYEDLDAAFGNNPVFIRLMAALGKELGEDTVPNDAGGGGDANKDFDAKARELREKLDKLPERDTKGRAAIMAELNQLYEKRYGTGKRAAFVTVGAGKAA